jgi:hypothetical protein
LPQKKKRKNSFFEKELNFLSGGLEASTEARKHFLEAWEDEQKDLDFLETVISSVADPDPNPDPDPPDPRIFGPPGSGSGSTSQRYGSGSGSCSGSGSGSFNHHAKIVRKTLIPPILWLFLNFYLWQMM